jgi:hypothetical protein
MPLHDWTRVEANTFHDFHGRWITHLTESLNRGLLPAHYYAQSEQHLGRRIGDVLTLHASDPDVLRTPPMPSAESGAVGVLEVEPQVTRKQQLHLGARHRPRTLTVRHTSGHRIIALVEVVSPGNKTAADNLRELTRKIVAALNAGIHVAVLDLLPPGPHDPQGIHGAVTAEVGDAPPEPLPEGKTLAFVSYAADPPETTAYQEYRGNGAELPELPLFLTPTQHIRLPLERTYTATFEGMAPFWRAVLEGRSAE